MSLASRSLIGSGFSCRLETPGQGDHGVPAPPTLTMSNSRPKTACFLLVGLHGYLLVVIPTTKMMQSASRESSPITSDSSRSAILLRGILRIARSHFEHYLVDERYARPVCQIYFTVLKVALPRLYRVCHGVNSPTEMAFVGAPLGPAGPQRSPTVSLSVGGSAQQAFRWGTVGQRCET